MPDTNEVDLPVPTTAPAKKPRKTPERSRYLNYFRHSATLGLLVVTVTVGKRTTEKSYWIERQADESFVLRKTRPETGEPNQYRIRLGDTPSCACKGWLYRHNDKPCRHVAALLILRQRGDI